MSGPFYPMGYRGDNELVSIPKYSGVIADPILTDTGAEPVTKEEAKAHCLFSSSDLDNQFDFWIKVARRKVEKRFNKSLIVRSISVVMSNGSGRVDLPYGPATAITSMTDISGNAVTDYTIRDFAWLESPLSGYLRLVYVAGYTPVNIPAEYKQAILEEVAYLYRHKGDDPATKGAGPWIV